MFFNLSPAKRELLRAAAANAVKILGVEKVELPESVKPVLEECDSRSSTPEPEERVRPEPVHERTQSQVGVNRVTEH